MGSLIQETLSAANWLRARSGGAWRARWLNEKPSVAVQAAIEPVESRDYCTGDDLTRVDWNRCARLDELVVRQYFGNELKSLDVWLDHSRSMSVAASENENDSKLDWGKRFASLVALQAINEGENVSIFGVSDVAEPIASSIRSRGQLPRLLPALETSQPRSANLDLAKVARGYLNARRNVETLVVITDLFDFVSARLVKALQLLSAANLRVCLLQLHTEFEVFPQATGRVEFEDIESGELRTAIINQQDLAQYQREVTAYLTAVRRICHRAGVLWARVNVNAGLDDVLLMLSRTSRIGRLR